MSYLAKASYATTATSFGGNSNDSYYTLGQTDASGGTVLPSLTVTGNLNVDGTAFLNGNAVVTDGTSKIQLIGQNIQARSEATNAVIPLYLNGDLSTGGQPVVAPAGLTVGGAAVPAATTGLNVQTALGRVAIAAGTNELIIQGFAADGTTAPLYLNTRDQAAPVFMPDVNAADITASTLTSLLGTTVGSFATSGKVGTVAAPVLFGTQLGYSGVLRLSATTGSFIGQFPMPPGCSLQSQIYLTQISYFGDVLPTNLSPPFCAVSAAGPTGFTVDIVQGQTTGVNVSMQCSYFIVV